MQVYVMLTVDLNRGVGEEARATFNESLKEKHWKKMNLTTTWYARFQEGVTAEAALRVTKSDLKAAAATAGISNYEGAAHAGLEAPSVWNQAS